MNRKQILADVLAVLEAERFMPVEPRPRPELEPITPEQAERNRSLLEDALSDDPYAAEWAARQTEDAA